jgi:GDSL-like Lipase/Acylhydrolase family
MRTTERDLVRGALQGAACVEDTSCGLVFHRLPAWTREQYGQDLAMGTAASQGSGVRLELLTAATWIELDLRFTRYTVPALGNRPRDAVLAVTVDGTHLPAQRFDEGNLYVVGPTAYPELTLGRSTSVRIDLGSPAVAAGRRCVAIWLPHTAAAELLGIRADADLVAAPVAMPRWVHYGSSISHCSNAETPMGVWPVRAAEQLGLHLTNLGLGGSAHLDPYVARTIRDLPADLISAKIGINVVNGNSFTARTFTPAVHGFLDTVREGHLLTPIVVISPIACPVHERHPGPTSFDLHGRAHHLDVSRSPADGLLTLRDIRAALASIVQGRRRTDVNLWYLDGLSLLGEGDVAHLVDGLHPDAAGYIEIADKFVALARDPESRLSESFGATAASLWSRNEPPMARSGA